MAKPVFQKKVCLLGDFAVGKTSLVRRYVEDRFDESYLSTIGVKISRRTIEFEEYDLNLLIWDLAGGDDFVKLSPTYLRGAVAALVVCDLTRQETLASFQFYAEQLNILNPDASLVFLGNKLDLEAERAITESELLAVSDSLNGSYLATSAKSGFQVEKAFQELADKIKPQ